jgi:uncharacterized protein (UPF0210 family)
MKIRTITLGINVNKTVDDLKISEYADLLQRAKSFIQNNGFTVQTIRLVTQPWEEYYTSKNYFNSLIKLFDSFCQKKQIDYVNIGTTFKSENLGKILDIISQTQHVFTTMFLAKKQDINNTGCLATAKLIKSLAPLEPEGFANLRFAALFNIPANTPFFPAAFHQGPPGLGIGTENSDIVFSAFQQAKDLPSAKNILIEKLTDQYSNLESIVETFCMENELKYNGIDPSICTSIDREESIAFAFEKLRLGEFGEPGTLTIARIITSALQSLKIKSCGYKGLMLPVMEDYGLAQRNNEGQFDITNLLMYSTVCGTGLDTIPLPGNVSSKKLYALLLDLASLSCKLQKPLSARLMPIPNKSAGEMTEFNFPYFVNTKVMDI